MKSGFEEIMSIRGRGMPAEGEVSITGSDPVYSARTFSWSLPSICRRCPST
jgi:hypothetical protein